MWLLMHGRRAYSLSPVHRHQGAGTEMSQCKPIIFTMQRGILLCPHFGSQTKRQRQNLDLANQEVLLGEWGGIFRAKLPRVSALPIEKFDLGLQSLAPLFTVMWYQGAEQTRYMSNFSQSWTSSQLTVLLVSSSSSGKHMSIAQTFPTVQFQRWS